MIVKCKDGNYYVNPVWSNAMTTITAVGSGHIELFHKAKKPVVDRTLYDAARRLGLSIGRIDVGGMSRMIFGEKFTDCFQVSIYLTSCPPIPAKYDAKLTDRPADGDDDIIDDWSLNAIKTRRLAVN